MDDHISEDIEECDDLTGSLNETVIYKGQIKDLKNASESAGKKEGDIQLNSDRKGKESGLNKNKCEEAVSESQMEKHEIVVLTSDVKKKESEIKAPEISEDYETGASEISEKQSWKRRQEEEIIKDNSILSTEASREEGECSATLTEKKSPRCSLVKKVNKKKAEPEMDYSSFIDSSKEEGECSTTSFEDNQLDITVKKAPPVKLSKVWTDDNNKRKPDFQPMTYDFEKELNTYKEFRKRKRSVSECNESTPKRRHLLINDGEKALSPIGFLPSSADKQRSVLEMADTPLIESKFRFEEVKTNFQEGVSSSTPVNTSQKFSFPSVVECSTPISATRTAKHNALAKKKILNVKESSDSDSDIPDLCDDVEIIDKSQTVEELIAEITQLCEDCEKTLGSRGVNDEQVGEKTEKAVSKIHLGELMSEWKTKSLCESSTDTEGEDKTLVADEKDDSLTDRAGSNESSNERDEDNVGRFKAEVTVSRLEDVNDNETNKALVDENNCDNDEHELQYADDLLNLDDYDDEGFVDAKNLEKSHLMNQTLKSKDTINNDEADKGKESVEQPENLLKLIPSLDKDDKDNDGLINADVNDNVEKGLDYAAFDTSIYRKNENTAIERVICRQWRTHGSADPDVNLTVASTKRNKCVESRKKSMPGQLEGDHMVCTNLYEKDSASIFQYYGQTTGPSNLSYMTHENLLNRLYNQKEILENMNRQSLMNIKEQLQWQLTMMNERHNGEMNALKYRQAMEDDQYRFYSMNQFNPIEIQNRIIQLRQDHLFQQNTLRVHQHNEFCAVRSQGLETLNQEVKRHSAQCEPIGQLIEQLENLGASNSSSPKKYGPPIVVNLRKAPCRACNGQHSTVSVCLSAGIAQAVSLEDDLYDHYYGY